MNLAYDSTTKRKELVRAAKELFHQKGFPRTTLAKVARRAGVPLGNVHYYFPSKRSLAEAVVEAHLVELRSSFAAWERTSPPSDRLRLLVRAPLGAPDSVIQFGCPHGSLCQELQKDEDSVLTKAGAGLLEAWVEWAQQQFEACGRKALEARDLAEQLVASIQGTMLMARALGSRDLLALQLSRLETWLGVELS